MVHLFIEKCHGDDEPNIVSFFLWCILWMFGLGGGIMITLLILFTE